MRTSLTVATLSMLGLLLTSAQPLPAQEGRPLPTGMNRWRIQCADGTVIPNFAGSYGAASHSSVCVGHGGITGIWDEGLGPLMHMDPPFLVTAFNTDDGSPPKIPPKWSKATCQASTCTNSVGDTLSVTYLDGRKSPGKSLNCNDIGLLNPKRLSSVPMRRIAVKPDACPIGVK